jgi:hypothetical protein
MAAAMRYYVETIPTPRIPDEGILSAGKHLEALFDKLPEGRWCKGYTFQVWWVSGWPLDKMDPLFQA